ARATGSIKIPPAVMTPDTNFRLTSCLLGSDDCRPFLQLLREALGHPNSVSAPKFLHDFASSDGQQNQFWESMVYDFWIVGDDNGRKPLATRDAVVNKFAASAFTFFDGTAVPSALWGQWVPAEANLSLNTTSVAQFTFDFPLRAIVDAKLGIVLHARGVWLSQV